MGIIDKLKSLMPTRSSPEAPDTELIYIFLPESVQPIHRGSRYEDPLEAELGALGLGEISGGGSQLGDERPDGSRPIEFCGIDVDVTDLSAGRDLLRRHLPMLGCPAGTELHYTEDGLKLQDEYDGASWRLAQPRTRLHPGFGV